MSPPVIESNSHTITGYATLITITPPSGIQDGDLLLAQISSRTTSTITGPSGWTLQKTMVDAAHSTTIWTKFASSESGSYTWDTPDNVKSLGGIMRISGVGSVHIVGANGSLAGGPPTAPSITTTINDCLLLGFILSADNSTFEPPGTMTEVWDNQTTNFDDISHSACYENFLTAGDTGTRTWTFGKTFDGGAFLVAIAPEVFHQDIGLLIGL